MSLTNTSQLLLRNVDLLNEKQVLLINAPADVFIDQYINHYPNSKISCFNSNYAEHLALKKANYKNTSYHFSAHYQSTTKHDLAIIFFPKSKKEFTFTLTMLTNVLAQNAKVLLVGENKGGVKSSIKLSDSILSSCEKIDSARHCSLYFGEFNNKNKHFSLDDWYQYYQLTINGINLTIASLPGVFSQSELDVGTNLLLKNLPNKLAGKVLDFGCGAGVISAYIGKKFNHAELSLLDISALALQSAEKTLAINNLHGNVFASNSLQQVTEKYQHVVSNPPFHQGLKTHYAATESFLSEIKNHLTKSANITIVANNFLHYQSIMEQYIGVTKLVTNEKGFCIYQSQHK